MVWHSPAAFAAAVAVLGLTVWAVGQYDAGLAWTYATLLLASVLLTRPEIVDAFVTWFTGVIG